MKTTKKIVIYISVFMAVIYVCLMPKAYNGYGYMGYWGNYDGPSYWYWNDTNYYYDKSVRNGSVSGANSRGGGPGQGK